MPLPETENALEFRQETDRRGVIFIVGTLGFFGALFLLGFFTRFPHLGPDDWVLGFLGISFLAFAWLLFRFLTQPRFQLTTKDVIVNQFFGKRRFSYDDINGLATYLEKIYPRSAHGRSLPPRIVHRLLVKTRDGKERRFTMPSFGPNDALILALEERWGRSVERLPVRDPKAKP